MTDTTIRGRSAEEWVDRGVNSARAHGDQVDKFSAGIDASIPADQMARVLAAAFNRLAEPGRVGDLRPLVDDLAEAMFDAAHENCDDDGCTGGGLLSYQEYVSNVLLPVLKQHQVPTEAVADVA